MDVSHIVNRQVANTFYILQLPKYKDRSHILNGQVTQTFIFCSHLTIWTEVTL